MSDSSTAEITRQSLSKRLRAGETLYTAWSGIPDPLVVETLARAGFDAVTLDMQHGFHTTDSVLRGIPAATLAGAPAIVRIPVGRYDMASRALDFGAQAVIAPMINSMDDARNFAEFMKVPPQGTRSWGPMRTIMLHGYGDLPTYKAHANQDTLAIAMIETRSALAEIDDILNLSGIDGVFVGPSDFSLVWSEGESVNPVMDDMMPAIAEIAEKAHRAGKIPAILAVSSEIARRYRDMGFRLIALANDTAYLLAGAGAMLKNTGQD